MIRPQIDAYDNYIPYPQYLKLLVRATDASTGIKGLDGYGRTITNVSGVTGSTTKTLINTNSIYFNGSSYLTIPDSEDWNFGSGDFTISFWINPTNSGTSDTVVLTQRSGEGADTISFYCEYIQSTSKWRFRVFYSTTSYGSVDIASITFNVWSHIYFTREGVNLKFYVNGTLISTVTAPTLVNNSSSVLSIGNDPAYPTRTITAYMDEITIWKGISVPISQLYPQNKPFSFRRA